MRFRTLVVRDDSDLDTSAAPPVQTVANERPVDVVSARVAAEPGSRQSGIAGVAGVRGRCGGVFYRLAGDGVLLRQPRAQVDQAAAIAAERAVWKLVRPLDLALAGRTS